MRLQLLFVFALTVYVCSFIKGEDGSGSDSCTNGFMSVDRMDDLLGNDGTVVPDSGDSQGIFPEVNFTCNGTILSWIFGAKWKGMNDSFTELQLWRPGSEAGIYTKNGSAMLTIGEENTTQLYTHILSTPMAFQVGDVLGYFQPEVSSSQSIILFEEGGRGQRQLGYYFVTTDPSSQLNISGPGKTVSQTLANVVTDPPGCGSGFMSVERMRLLLNVDSTGTTNSQISQRQQLTPDMIFTCDGLITKWIIGADWNGGFDDKHYPEIQIWRNSGNDIYQKINGTFIEIPTESDNLIYEYDNFSPIPIQAGDILGVFIPLSDKSRLRLLSERPGTPINYYLTTNATATESPYDVIDTRAIQPVTTGRYHPMVSVEIVRSPAALPPPQMTTTYKNSPKYHTTLLPSSEASPMTEVPTQSSGGGSLHLYISVGVSVVVLGLIVATVIAISVTVCLRQKNRMTATNNVAYGVNQNEMELSDNVAYSASTEAERVSVKYEEIYDYVSNATTGGDNIIISASPNKAYGISGELPVFSNQAYGMMQS